MDSENNQVNIDTINEQLQYLSETKNSIKQAIIDKGQTIQNEDTFRSYVDKIADISTLEAETRDADATDFDIVAGKTAYVQGEKVVGTLTEQTGIGFYDERPGYYSYVIEDNMLKPKWTSNERLLIAKNAEVSVWLPQEEVANAIQLTGDKLIEGVTILGVEGTVTPGIDTSDANATNLDIASGKTAYVNGEKITGIVNTTSEGEVLEINTYNSESVEIQNGNLSLRSAFLLSRFFREGSIIKLTLKDTYIADACSLTADKLVEGNTILGIEGTAIELKGQTKTITPTTTEQLIQPDAEYNGLTSVTVSAVDNTIDSNIIASNIKKDVTILGVTGTYEGDNSIIESETVESLPTVVDEGKVAVIMSSGIYGGTYMAQTVKTESASTTNVTDENLTVGTNIVKFVRTTFAPMDTMKDATQDILFFKNASETIVYKAVYEDISEGDVNAFLLKVQLIDNGTVYQIGYYDSTQSKWNQEIDEDIELSTVCKIAEINSENLTIMNGEFTYDTVQDSDTQIKWTELAAAGTLSTTQYTQALETAEDILGQEITE